MKTRLIYIFEFNVALLITCVCVLAEEFKTDGPSLDDSLSDILLWAILTNRKELANIYWLNGKNQLSKLNKYALTNANRIGNNINSLWQEIGTHEMKIIHILNILSKNNLIQTYNNVMSMFADIKKLKNFG